MSEVRSISAVATAPAVALRKPEKDAMEKLEVNRFVEDAVVEKRFVVVAFVVGEFVTKKFEYVLCALDGAAKYPAFG